MGKFFCKAALITLTFSLPVSANDCLINKYQAYTQAQKKWQQQLTQLIVKQSPANQDEAYLLRDEQLVAINKNALAVQLLLVKQADRVKVDKPVNRWLDLTHSERASLAKANQDYQKLTLRQAELNKAKAGFDFTKLRAALKDKVMSSTSYRTLYGNFRAEVDKVNQIQCLNSLVNEEGTAE